MATLPVFYYPSTIIQVDDDTLFLQAISKMLFSDQITKTFDDPETCMTYLENYQTSFPNISFLRGHSEHDLYETINHSPVDFNISLLSSLKDQPNRTSEISVIIVDYAMPKMNGLELCRKLKNFPFKKILLTGEADHRAAVAAFNDNIIDKFIQKSSASVANDLKSYVNLLQQQYFRERTQHLLSHLEVDCPLALSDPAFVNFFHNWCRDHSIREYALIDKNGSFMIINEKNECAYLIVHTDRTLDSFVKLYDDVSDAKQSLDSVKQRKKIPFFGVSKESWQFEATEWANYLHPHQTLEGREKYYWTVISDQHFNKEDAMLTPR